MLGTNRLPSGNAGVPTPDSLSSLPSKFSFYDVALAVLPVPLLVGFVVEELLSLTPGAGVAVGAAASALAVGYLLFGNPPLRRGPSRNRGRRDGVDGPSA